MADKGKRQKPSITPAGTARYPWLSKPDTKFDDAGKFKLDLILDASEQSTQDLMASIDEMVDEKYDEVVEELKPAAKKKLGKHYPYEMELDEDTEEETGRVIFKFSSNASGTIKNGPKAGQTWSKKRIPVFDAKNKPTKVQVGGGSIVKAAYTTSTYHAAALKIAGVKLYLSGVQVIELNQMGGDGSSMGFGQEDGGFEAGADEPDTSADDQSDEDDDEDDEDEADY